MKIGKDCFSLPPQKHVNQKEDMRNRAILIRDRN